MCPNTIHMWPSMVHHLASGVEATFAPGCSLVLETARLASSCDVYIVPYVHYCPPCLCPLCVYTMHRFMLELKKEQQLEYVRRVTEMAKAIGHSVS